MFVQVIQGRVKDAAAVKTRGDAWSTEVGAGAVGFLGSTGGVTDDLESIVIARFDSAASAKANSARPEQDAWWKETVKLYDGEPTFSESTDVTTFLRGGADDAGFVQVMLGRTAEREVLERQIDGAIDMLSELRPDLIGGLMIWLDGGRFVQVNYFTTEAEARAAERKEQPAEFQERMQRYFSVVEDLRYLDLHDPWLAPASS